MTSMNASPQQIAAAAAAGVALLSDKDLKVPLGVAIGGQLNVLQSMLGALATGELVLINAPQPEQKPAAGDGDGGGDPPGLTRIEGGKQKEGDKG